MTNEEFEKPGVILNEESVQDAIDFIRSRYDPDYKKRKGINAKDFLILLSQDNPDNKEKEESEKMG